MLLRYCSPSLRGRVGERLSPSLRGRVGERLLPVPRIIVRILCITDLQTGELAVGVGLVGEVTDARFVQSGEVLTVGGSTFHDGYLSSALTRERRGGKGETGAVGIGNEGEGVCKEPALRELLETASINAVQSTVSFLCRTYRHEASFDGFLPYVAFVIEVYRGADTQDAQQS